MPAEALEEVDVIPRKFTTSEAARWLQTSYHGIVYNVGAGRLLPDERTEGGTLIFYEETLREFARTKGLTPAD